MCFLTRKFGTRVGQNLKMAKFLEHASINLNFSLKNELLMKVNTRVDFLIKLRIRIIYYIGWTESP